MRLLSNITILLILLTYNISCSNGGGGGSSGGTATSSNKFTVSGNPITIDNITSANSSSSLSALTTSSVYYARFLYTDGSDVFAGSAHFTLNKNDNSSAYFTDFYLDRLVELSSYNSNSVIVSSSTNLNTPSVWNSSTNTIEISNATSRFVSFTLNFGNNAHLSDIDNAGVIFSNDFSTMVGGDNANFFFIAQKASSLGTVTTEDLKVNWDYANFTVSSSGTLSLANTGNVKPSGTGGNGLTAFTGSTDSGDEFQGEVELNDSSSGIFIFGFDTSNGSVPTADGNVDGGFLMSPDKQYILGYNLYDNLYFAASR